MQGREFWFEFPFPATTQETTQKTTQETEATTQEMSGKVRVETRVEILKLLSELPRMTLAEFAKQIGKSVSAVERASSKLVNEGKLRHIGPKKGGHWEVLRENCERIMKIG